METINFLKFFINSNIVLFFSLVLILIFFTNTTLLRKRGFSDEFIKFKKRDYTKRIIGMMIAVPVLELAAGLITYLIFGELANANHLLITFLIFIVLVIPFPIIDSMKTRKKQEEIMEKTKSSVVVDIKYRIFHLIFNPYLEFTATAFVIVYFVLFIDHVSPLINIHLALIWMMYVLIRRAKKMNKPILRETYYYTSIILVINHLLVIFHVVYPFVANLECCADAFMFMAGINLAVLLVLKMGYYLFQFPEMKKGLN